MGSAGDGFLGDVADGLITFTEIGFDGRGFPTQAVGNVVDGKAGSAKGNGGCDAVGMGDKSFDVDAQVVRGVWVCPAASGLHDVLDVFSRQKMESA